MSKGFLLGQGQTQYGPWKLGNNSSMPVNSNLSFTRAGSVWGLIPHFGTPILVLKLINFCTGPDVIAVDQGQHRVCCRVGAPNL